MAENALKRDTAWLQAALKAPATSELPTEVAVLNMRAPVSESDGETYGDDLKPKLKAIDPSIEVLRIEEDTPTNPEWDLLAGRFSKIRALSVETGWNEDWIDGSFPLSWPLELLEVSSACGALVTTPAIIEGRVPHLVLFLTCGLRFEGPTTAELSAAAPAHEMKREDGKIITIKYLGEASMQWMNDKYGGKPLELDDDEGERSSRLRTLEIVENDAWDTFLRFALARWPVVSRIENLNIRSTLGNDLGSMDEGLVPQILPNLTALRHLKLSVGEGLFTTAKDFQDSDPDAAQGIELLPLPNLHKLLPAGLEELHFRGPTSMTTQLDGWVQAMGDPEWLPNLKRISFALDVYGKNRDPVEDVPTLSALMSAKIACGKLLKVAAERGVEVVEFEDQWAGVTTILRGVDERWAGISDVE